MMWRWARVALVGLSALGIVRPAAAQEIAIALEEVASGFTQPVAVAHAGDGSDRLFVVQQSGEIRIVSGGTVLPQPFLDLSGKVSNSNEQGLLGLAFHPDYAANGFFYVDYTDLSGDTVVERYKVSADDPDEADPASDLTVLTQDQPFANHNAGQLAFGPDGYLYIALGDGGGGGDPLDRAQDLTTWLGKILRVDVDGDDFPADPNRNYAVPDDNPFVDAPGRDEIWAYGLRNPWRFSFDRATGDLWIADVGQNAWEEIDFQPAASDGGENYGWDVLEGGLQTARPGPGHPNCFEDDPGGDGSCRSFLTGGSILPVLEYDHSLGCSVTGGYRYRGQLEPELSGIYFYADFCSGRIWGARPRAGSAWDSEQLLDTTFRIAAFGESETGEVYVAEYGSSDGQGKLHRIVGVGFSPRSLVVDPAVLDSNGNRVFEPGETVVVAPAWRHNGDTMQDLTGTASNFIGPGGDLYSLEDDEADYGSLTPGETAGCRPTGDCFELRVMEPAVRPATRWQATFVEELDDAGATTKPWILHIGDSFTDVSRASSFYRSIEALLGSGVTAGCTATRYCPGGGTRRAQMPVFMLRARQGADYVPPPCVEGAEEFTDVPFDHIFCPWIEELARRDVVSGCGSGRYCPANQVTRAQMAVFLLRTLEGRDYVPPECSDRFDDVPCPSLFADWIEDLATRGITEGCTANRYCPTNPVSRAQMAVFVVRTFDFRLYGP